FRRSKLQPHSDMAWLGRVIGNGRPIQFPIARGPSGFPSANLSAIRSRKRYSLDAIKRLYYGVSHASGPAETAAQLWPCKGHSQSGLPHPGDAKSFRDSLLTGVGPA